LEQVMEAWVNRFPLLVSFLKKKDTWIYAWKSISKGRTVLFLYLLGCTAISTFLNTNIYTGKALLTAHASDTIIMSGCWYYKGLALCWLCLYDAMWYVWYVHDII
jgi:hypothetical protein